MKEGKGRGRQPNTYFTHQYLNVPICMRFRGVKMFTKFSRVVLGKKWKNKVQYHSDQKTYYRFVFSMPETTYERIFMRFGDVEIFTKFARVPP